MKSGKYLAVSLAAALLVSGTSVAASANNGANNTASEGTYVLMNIPYAEFYKADLNNDVKVDVFTSATKTKTRGTLAAGSYHVDDSGDEITGVIFPVKLGEGVDLSSFKQITDSDSIEITVTNKGKTSTNEYVGKDALFESPSYSYYVLDEAPDYYKTAELDENGKLVFGEVNGTKEEISAEYDFTLDSKYGDYELDFTSEALDQVSTVYGVVISTEEGNDYGLRHLENIWKVGKLAWSTGYTTAVHNCPTSSAHYEQIVGQTISQVTYYTDKGIKTISNLSIYVDPVKYVLMNVPYADFYANEVENDVPVDVYTSATKAKTLTGNLAGGTYHINEDGSAIDGVTYPVKIGSNVDLSKYRQITDEDKYEVTVTNRGQTTTTTYEGKDALFNADSYSYYVLDEVPAFYKSVSADEDGKLEFAAQDKKSAEVLEGVEAEFTTETSYGDYELDFENLDIDINEHKVYGVVLETEDGTSYGLRHLENIWRGTELAWATGFTDSVHGSPTSSAHYESIMGKTIKKVTYYTDEGIKTFEVDVYVPVKTGANASVEDAPVAAGAATLETQDFAEDFEPEYVFADSDGNKVEFTVDGSTVSYPTDAANGQYTLTISDKSGKYADVITSFNLTVAAPAEYNGDILSETPALKATDSDEAFAAYLAAINKVTVNGESYNASGKRSVVVIDPETGAVDTSNADIFVDGAEEFAVIVEATGYESLSFTIKRTADEPAKQDDDNQQGDPAKQDDDNKQDEPAKQDDTTTPDDNKQDDSKPTDNSQQVTVPSDNGQQVVPADNSSDSNPSTPDTADHTPLFALLALLGASAAAVFSFRRRNRE
ncbi:MAG: hypothetical protein IJ861_03595 [Clostridia bacterium]|nr:hypothetical protein [Clostridia bacterium]